GDDARDAGRAAAPDGVRRLGQGHTGLRAGRDQCADRVWAGVDGRRQGRERGGRAAGAAQGRPRSEGPERTLMRWRRPSWVAWLLAVVLAGILGYALLAHSAGATARCYTAVLVSVERVLDGDTFDAQLSEAVWLGLYLDLRERIRVLGVDAWELHDPRGPA